MRTPSLSVDTFAAALAVLAAAASSGCSKADHASVAPEPAAAVAPGVPAPSGEQGAAATAPAAQNAPAPSDPAVANAAADNAKPTAPNVATKSAAASPVAAAAVDGGVKRAADADGKKKAGMSCGAGMCSADMKKGSGN
jgi:hypothetical protein